jgi:peptidoglycan/LPS O-acetylase OafA/YrhL
MSTALLRSRMWLIDLGKALGAQLIVLHHLAWYGPLSHDAMQLGPKIAEMVAWLANYGRYAVALFIVTGGFLAAQSLSPRVLRAGISPGCLIRSRYLRLVLPYAVALLIVIACYPLAHALMDHESVGSPPRLAQLLAHLSLLHGVLGVESLSAGVWYVAIDFQLYALFVLLLWFGNRFCRLPTGTDFWIVMPTLMLALASLFYFNRVADWDSTGLYFFGVYALGFCTGWAAMTSRPRRLLLLLTSVALFALWVEFRPRIAIGIVTALALGWGSLVGTQRETKLLHYFGKTSYSLFLIHFPICLLINAGVSHFAPDNAKLGAVGVLAAWLASNLAAHVFHRHVELPLAHWQRRLRLCGTLGIQETGRRITAIATAKVAEPSPSTV